MILRRTSNYAGGVLPETVTMTFTLKQEQKELIDAALASVEPVETFGNTNENGNKLYEVVRQWDELKK